VKEEGYAGGRINSPCKQQKLRLNGRGKPVIKGKDNRDEI
jgi:hypothetical protein